MTPSPVRPHLKRSNLAFLIHPKSEPQSPQPQPDSGYATVWDRFHLDVRGLETVKLISSDGVCIGVMLGTLVDYHKQRIIRTVFNLECSAQEYLNNIEKIETTIYALNGSWIAILVIGQLARIYVDAGATLGVVYEAARKVAGSGANELLDESEYWERLDWKLHKALNVSTHGWFPAGLTAHTGINRLIPNHYLDLNTWLPVRHWPKEPIPCNPNYGENLDRIAQVTAATIKTIVADGSTAMALTGGHDTRCLLALSRPLWKDVEFIVFAFPGSEMDVTVSQRIATRYNLTHHVFPAIRGSQQQIDTWLYQACHCAGAVTDATHAPSLEPLKKYTYFLGGGGGGVAHGFFHRSSDSDDLKLSAQNVIYRMGLRPIEPLLTIIAKWMQQQGDVGINVLLDLAYIELRMGSFSPYSYADYPTNQLHPLGCREVYDSILRLPRAVKSNNAINQITKRLDPELLFIPVNKYGDMRDYWLLLQKLLRPSIVIKKIRKAFC